MQTRVPGINQLACFIVTLFSSLPLLFVGTRLAFLKLHNQGILMGSKCAQRPWSLVCASDGSYV